MSARSRSKPWWGDRVQRPTLLPIGLDYVKPSEDSRWEPQPINIAESIRLAYEKLRSMKP